MHQNHLLYADYLFSAIPQIGQTISPVVYFHFETNQCWINHGTQFVMEELPFAKVDNLWFCL